MFKIMIVEDNEQIQNEIGNLLTKNGYEIIKANAFNNIPIQIKDNNPHLVLLDINLPNHDGFKICTEVRSFSTVPIIFVTSRNTNVDELMSITLGGDDFITKPYNTQILLARINSLLKRSYPNEKSMEIIEVYGVKLNVLASTVEYNGVTIELTKNELKILYFLIDNKGKIVSRYDIMEYLWDSSLFINDNTLTVNITRIRNKLECIGVKNFIKTKRGQSRFKILRQLGIDNAEINKIILKQILVYFILPVSIAIVGFVVFMINFTSLINSQIKAYIGDKGLILNVGFSLSLMIIIYVCYFIGTYYSFKRNISEDMK